MDAEQRIELGYVSRAHGIRGELRVHLHNPESGVLQKLKSVVLRLPSTGQEQVFRLVGARAMGKDTALRLAGVTDRTAAEALVGWVAMVSRDALPPPDEDEFYLVDLIGAQVVSDDGQPVGSLVDVLQTPAHDVFVIQSDAHGELLVPAIGHYIGPVDVQNRRVTLLNLQDLLEG